MFRNGRVLAVGTLTGTVRYAAGNVIGRVERTLRLPLLGSSRGSCQILHLVLGPLDLNLLGLRVRLSRIVLNITAEPGSLLGDLLCAIANLLNRPNLLGRALARLLNRLLGLL